LESEGGKVTGTTENQYGDVISLTARKYISEYSTEGQATHYTYL
jgi:hypothetical protein